MATKLDYQEFKYKLNQPKYKSYTYFAFSAFVSVILTFFFIRPTLIEITTLLKTINSGKELSEKLTTKLTNLSIAEQKISTINDKVYLIDKALPEIINSPIIIDNISSIANKNGVILQSTQISNIETTPEEYGEKMVISISTNVNGSYENIVAFTNALEENLNLTSVTSLSLTKSSESFTANYTINIYGYNFEDSSIENKLVPFSIEKK